MSTEGGSTIRITGQKQACKLLGDLFKGCRWGEMPAFVSDERHPRDFIPPEEWAVLEKYEVLGGMSMEKLARLGLAEPHTQPEWPEWYGLFGNWNRRIEATNSTNEMAVVIQEATVFMDKYSSVV